MTGVQTCALPILSCLGYLDQARLRRDEALSEARRLSPYTLAIALAFTSRSFWAIEGVKAVQTMLRSANELSAFSHLHGLPLVSTYADLIRGWSLGALGKTGEGIHKIGRASCRERVSVVV